MDSNWEDTLLRFCRTLCKQYDPPAPELMILDMLDELNLCPNKRSEVLRIIMRRLVDRPVTFGDADRVERRKQLEANEQRG